MLLAKDFKNASKSLLLAEVLPRALIKLLKLDVSDELLESVELLSEDELLLSLLNCAIRLCNLLSMSPPPPIPIGGGGGGGISLVFDEASFVLLALLCDCNAASRFCIKVPKAAAASVLDVVSVLVLESVLLVDDVLDALASPNKDDSPPEIPAAFSALSMAPNNPPPSLP